MADIFISYAHEDIERIKLLASGLASHGRSVFWDRTIPPGKTWRNWIGKSLAEARCVVVAWSEASIHSEWVCEEAEEGKERNILVPVFVGDVRPPMGFRAIQGATLVDWNGGLDDQSFQQLVDAVAEILGPVAPTPENSRRLQSISKQPVVSTAPVDLRVAETTPATQSVETPGDAQAERGRASPHLGIQQDARTEETGLISKLRSAASLFRTTATYGQGFKRTEVSDQYSVKVYVGGFAGPKTADEGAKEEIEMFMKNKGYTSYEIINRRYSFIPSYYEYTVQFRRI